MKYLLSVCMSVFLILQCEGMKNNVPEDIKVKSKKYISVDDRLRIGELLPPTVDLVFKKIFGAEENKDILINFINSILEFPAGQQISYIDLLNTEIAVEAISEKLSRLDLLAQTEKNELINIEIQVVNTGNMVNRSLYYFSKLFSSSLKKNQPYKELPKVIMINLLNYSHYKSEKKGLWHFLLKDDETNHVGSDLLHIYMFELTKYEIDVTDKQHAWISFLKAPESTKVQNAANTDKYLKRAEEELKKISEDNNFIATYRMREDALRNQESAIITAEEKGRMEKAREAAIKMLNDGLPIATVAKYSGLTEEQIKELQKLQ